jgi:hypothetical protein
MFEYYILNHKKEMPLCENFKTIDQSNFGNSLTRDDVFCRESQKSWKTGLKRK